VIFVLTVPRYDLTVCGTEGMWINRFLLRLNTHLAAFIT